MRKKLLGDISEPIVRGTITTAGKFSTTTFFTRGQLISLLDNKPVNIETTFKGHSFRFCNMKAFGNIKGKQKSKIHGTLHNQHLATPAQVAEYLGIGPACVKYWVKTGRLPCVRIGCHPRFDMDKIKELEKQGAFKKWGR